MENFGVENQAGKDVRRLKWRVVVNQELEHLNRVYTVLEHQSEAVEIDAPCVVVSLNEYIALITHLETIKLCSNACRVIIGTKYDDVKYLDLVGGDSSGRSCNRN